MTHQHKIKNQQLINDQNYVNRSLFALLSTIQSIIKGKQGLDKKSTNKKYGAYDYFDYSLKDEEELKSQLQTQIICFLTCMQQFDKAYPNSFQLPQKFNSHEFQREIQEISNYFMLIKDQQCLEMVSDIKSIVNKKWNELNIIKKEYGKNKHTENKKIFLKGAMMASNHIATEKQKIENLKISHRKDLPVEINIRKKKIVEKQIENQEDQKFTWCCYVM